MRDLPLILFGVGGVGRSFLNQILEHRDYHARHYGLALRVLAVCDRDGALIDTSDGLDDETLREALLLKEKGGRLLEHLQGGAQGDPQSIVDIAGREGAVVVDCTAADVTADALIFALERGYKIALANKKPLTGSQEVYDRLTTAGVTVKTEGQADSPADSLVETVGSVVDSLAGSRADSAENGKFAARHLGRSRWETTVGAGLPAIATLNRLLASGDTVHRIAGAFSGTLGYVMTGLQEGRAFSEIVREAHALGYTEPDPRDDLGGVDVARKALILARGLGYKLDMEQVSVTGLYPAEMADLSVDAFMDALPSLDEEFRDRVAEATAAGKVLRFAATIEAGESGGGDAPETGRCSAGPVVVDVASPLGRLTGTDNLVEYHTRWYDPNPLVIQGRGAGAEATAAGVLSDVIELAYTI